MHQWDDVERAAATSPGWRRQGREYHGPCPVTGAGRTKAWVGPGAGGGVRIGCRHCDPTGLSSRQVREHLEALCGSSGPGVSQSLVAPSAPVQDRNPSRWLPGRVWGAAGDVSGTPGAVYLAGRCACPGGALEAVRWLSSERAAGLELRPRLPSGAAGAVLYRFARSVEVDTAAVQLEAVSSDGERLQVPRRVQGADGRWTDGDLVKRPSVTGSRFSDGARVFVARRGPSEGECWLTEGPVNALALVVLSDLGVKVPGDAAVLGVAGTAGMTAAAVAGFTSGVVVASDGDGPGWSAARDLILDLRRSRREVRPEPAPPGSDWGDVAADELSEAAAVLSERAGDGC